MSAEPNNGGVPGLRRALGTVDLVLLNVAAILGLRWLSTAATVGPAGLSLWVIAFILFFVPSGLAVQELSSRIPHEGGLYLWTRAAFGDRHGFLAGWAYWLSNLVYFPSLLLFGSGIFLHIFGGSALMLAESPVYNGIFCLALLWATTALNIFGLRRAKWLQNMGGITTIAIVALVFVGGLVAWRQFGSATPISQSSLLPHLNSLPTLGMLAITILAYQGLELGPIMGDEIKDSSRSIRRAILISGLLIAATYVAGTLALLVAMPSGHISAISGVAEAMAAVGQKAAIPLMGVTTAVLLTLSTIGGFGAWVTGTARLPFVIGLRHYLPERLAAVHPKYGTPHMALLVQATAASAVLLAAISGSAIHEAFLLLIDMTAALSSVVWVYIFASLAVLRWRAAGQNADVALIPGGSVVCWLVSATGVAATSFAVVVSLIPPVGSSNPALFLLKGVGGCLLIFLVGAIFYRQGRRRMQREQATIDAAKES
ncbi:MAG TPA: APC family permease [Steroidobacteraceae bacterium]